MKIHAYLLVVALAGCQSTNPAVDETKKPTKAPKKPMMCTMQYDPVCATIELNGQTVKKTFGNNCMLGNAAGSVVSSFKGECGKPPATH